MAKHSSTHVDCLVGAKLGEGFATDARDYINSIRPLDVISFSGLNTYKMFGGFWNRRDLSFHRHPNAQPESIPSGAFAGQSVPQAVRGYGASRFAALIYGSNNRKFFDEAKLTVDDALILFFKEMSMLFQGTGFDVVFISTIFPRIDDINERNELRTNVKRFNDELLSVPNRAFKYHIKITDKDGVERRLHWVPVDMTDVLPYGDIRNLKYFCEENSNRRKKDRVHVNATYLEIYYRKLDEAINRYKRGRKLRKAGAKKAALKS